MRIAKASVELATAPQFDYVILNDELDKALKEAETLVSNHIHTSPTKEEENEDRALFWNLQSLTHWASCDCKSHG